MTVDPIVRQTDDRLNPGKAHTSLLYVVMILLRKRECGLCLQSMDVRGDAADVSASLARDIGHGMLG